MGIFLALAFVIMQARAYGDFKIFLEASQLLSRHKDIYNVSLFSAPDVSGLYYYSPLWATILVPFTFISPFIPKFLWLSASVFWLVRSWVLIKRRFDLSMFSEKQKIFFLLISFAMVFRFVLYNFSLIQMTVFILWAVLESLSLFEKKKNIYGSALLALAINIKLLPVVIVPYLVYRRQFIPALFTTVFFVIYLFLPAIFIGISFNDFLLHEWWSVINPAQTTHTIEADKYVHSLTALIPSLFTPTQGDLPITRNILSLSPEAAGMITNVIRFAIIAWTLYFLGVKKNNSRGDLHVLREVSYILMVIPLIFPHQQKYAFYLLLPACAYVTYYMMRVRTLNEKRTKWISCMVLLLFSFLLMTLTTDGLIGRHYNDITQHFKTITWGALLLIVVISLCDPKDILQVVTEK